MRGECEWFLKCENDATTTVAHPVLGKVPSCSRCAAFARGDSKSKKTRAQQIAGRPQRGMEYE